MAAATRYYLWPFMHNEIAQTIKECIVCIERGDRQPNEPMLKNREEIKEPMYCVGMDHCVYERQNYLVMVDEFSSFPLITKVRSTDTADLIKHAEAWFLDLGFPKIIKSDGGPAFTSKAWDDYCAQLESFKPLEGSKGWTKEGIREEMRLGRDMTPDEMAALSDEQREQLNRLKSEAKDATDKLYNES